MNAPGHNENAIRLAALAGDAQIALDRIVRGETDSFAGWLSYGAALNEGRSLFAGDKEFGQWVEANALSQLATGEVNRDERIAAMWAAANADQFEEARAAGNARTVRGIHAQWKKIEEEREKARAEEERRQKAEADRKEAAAKAEAAKIEAARAEEEAARKAADEAASDEERIAAEKQAEEAAKAAEIAGQEAEAAAKAAEPAPPVDPYAKERKALAKFTREGIEQELIETRTALREETEKRKAEAAKRREAEKKAKELKETLDAITSQDAKAANIAKLEDQMRSLGYRKKEDEKEIARLHRQVRAQQSEIKALRKKLGEQVVEL